MVNHPDVYFNRLNELMIFKASGHNIEQKTVMLTLI